MIVRLYDAKRMQSSTALAFNVEGHIDIVTDETYNESVIVSENNYHLDVEWTNRADDHKEAHPVWNADIGQRIREQLAGEYGQANNMIDFASRAKRPCNGGLINVDTSVKDFMAWLKMQLNIKEK